MGINDKLDEIEARFASDAAEEVVYDVPPLVKALRAVLALADRAHPRGPSITVEDLRAAITEAFESDTEKS